MSVFPTIHTERIAPGSFQQPVPIPAALPGAPPFVTVCFNASWLPYILGCLYQLALNTTWIASTQDELNGALQQANQMILIFQQALPGCQSKNPGFAGSGDDFMLRQNPDNPCLLETSVDGVTWCTWADLSKCTSPTQPGAKSPNPPSGDCASAFATVLWNDRWVLPQNVSTGDVIKVKNLTGTWDANAVGLFFPPLCPDGNVFFEVGCISGTQFTDGGDPAPALPHCTLLAFDGTNYYDCGPATEGEVTITIAGGVSRSNLYFFCNNHYTKGFGSVSFDVQYCNNAVGAWTHTFDFTVSTGGWVPTHPGASDLAVYIVGVGWGSVVGLAGPNSTDLDIKSPVIPPTTITRVEVLYSTDTDDAGGGSRGVFTNPGGLLYGALDPTHGSFDTVLINTVGGVTQIVVNVDRNALPASTAYRCTKVIVSGNGTDPF